MDKETFLAGIGSVGPSKYSTPNSVAEHYGLIWVQWEKDGDFEAVLSAYLKLPGQRDQDGKFIYGRLAVTEDKLEDVEDFQLIFGNIKEEMWQVALEEFPTRLEDAIFIEKEEAWRSDGMCTAS